MICYKVKEGRNLGLKPKQKFLLQLVVGFIAANYFYSLGYETQFYFFSGLGFEDRIYSSGF